MNSFGGALEKFPPPGGAPPSPPWKGYPPSTAMGQIKIKADATAWDFIFDIGIEDEYGRDIERYEREAVRDMNRTFLEYNRQYRRFRESQGTHLAPLSLQG